MSKSQMQTESRLDRVKNKILLQLCGILFLSVVIGFAFNTSHPFGVSFEQTVSRDTLPPVAKSRIAPAAVAQSGDETDDATHTHTHTHAAAAVAPSPSMPVKATWDDVKPLWLRGKILLVDARGKAEYDNGHIPGAVTLPKHCTPEQYSEFKDNYDFNTPIAVYCSSQSCSLSEHVAERLGRSGYKSVQYFTGGYQEFQKREVIVAGDLPLRVPEKNPSIITWKDAKPAWLRGRALLVDARGINDYERGHIPGAISLPQGDPPETIAAFRQKYDLKTPLIIYCSDENCSLSDKLAEKLVDVGYESVRYMPGGYREYQQTELVPVRRAAP